MAESEAERGIILSSRLKSLLREAGLLVIIYPIFCIAYQVGFFWDASVSLLPAFQYTEHLLNASGPFIVLALMFTFAMLYIFPFLVGRVVLGHRSTKGVAALPKSEGDADKGQTPSGWKRLYHAVFLAIGVGYALLSLYMLTFARAELVVFAFFFCFILAAIFDTLQKYYFRRFFKRLSIITFCVAGILAVPAFGNMHFHLIMNNSDLGVQVSYQKHQCKLIMYGNERSLIGCQATVYLVENGDYKLAILTRQSEVFPPPDR